MVDLNGTGKKAQEERRQEEVTKGVLKEKGDGGDLKKNQEKRKNMKLPDNGRTEQNCDVSGSNECVFAGPSTGRKGWKQTHTGGNLQTRWACD